MRIIILKKKDRIIKMKRIIKKIMNYIIINIKMRII
jgi:hypothetical protein